MVCDWCACDDGDAVLHPLHRVIVVPACRACKGSHKAISSVGSCMLVCPQRTPSARVGGCVQSCSRLMLKSCLSRSAQLAHAPHLERRVPNTRARTHTHSHTHLDRKVPNTHMRAQHTHAHLHTRTHTARAHTHTHTHTRAHTHTHTVPHTVPVPVPYQYQYTQLHTPGQEGAVAGAIIIKHAGAVLCRHDGGPLDDDA